MEIEKIRLVDRLDLKSERKGGIKMTPNVLDIIYRKTFIEVEKGSW